MVNITRALAYGRGWPLYKQYSAVA